MSNKQLFAIRDFTIIEQMLEMREQASANEVPSGGRTAGEKRRARSASTAAISRSSDQGFAALRARSRLCRAGRRQLPRTGSASGP